MRGQGGFARTAQRTGYPHCPVGGTISSLPRKRTSLHYPRDPGAGIRFSVHSPPREQGWISAGNVPGSLGTPASGSPSLDQPALPGGPGPERGIARCCCLRPLGSVAMRGPESPAGSLGPGSRTCRSGILGMPVSAAAARPLTCCHRLPSGRTEDCLPSLASPASATTGRSCQPGGDNAARFHSALQNSGLTRLPIPRMLIQGPEVHKGKGAGSCQEHSSTLGCVGKHREENVFTDTEAALSLGDNDHPGPMRGSVSQGLGPIEASLAQARSHAGVLLF